LLFVVMYRCVKTQSDEEVNYNKSQILYNLYLKFSEKFTKIVNDKSVTHNFCEPVLLLRSFQVKKMINIKGVYQKRV
jgi:hypothetical protein